MPYSTERHSAAKSRPESSTTGLQPERRAKSKQPLWLHSTGQWAKKIRGRFHYFGRDYDAALKEYVRVKDDLEAGRSPASAGQSAVTVKDLCNHFLTHKQHQVELGELRQRSFEDYEQTCQAIAKSLGKTTLVEQIQPADLLRLRREFAERLGPTALGNQVSRVRTVLTFAFENALIDKPVRFGEFKKPKKSAMRRRRDEVGCRLLEPSELRKLLNGSDIHLRAMILLGLNCGFGNADCGLLPMKAVDLANGWINYPRPKTGIERRSPLWPETVAALEESLRHRREPVDPQDGKLFFITSQGNPWFSDGAKKWPLSAEFRKLLNRHKLYRPGVSFYSLRHCFQTVADEVGDYIATKRIMGHADGSMSDTYRERFSDERLRRVVEHVRDWLFGKDGAE